MALFINNARWDGVPFLLKAGKALASRRTEIRVQFHHVPGSLYRDRMGDADRATNELVRACCPGVRGFETLTLVSPSMRACSSTTSRAASTATAWATPTAPPTSWCAPALGSGGIILNPESGAPRSACSSTTSRAASTATAWATPTAPPTSWCAVAGGQVCSTCGRAAPALFCRCCSWCKIGYDLT